MQTGYEFKGNICLLNPQSLGGLYVNTLSINLGKVSRESSSPLTISLLFKSYKVIQFITYHIALAE